MSKISMILILVCVAFLAGCATLTHDEEQQVRKYSRIADLDRRMLAEDIDTILLLDKPSRLSEWHVPMY